MSPVQRKWIGIVLALVIIVAAVVGILWAYFIPQGPTTTKLKIAGLGMGALESSFFPPMYNAIKTLAEVRGDIEWVWAENVAYADGERVIEDYCKAGYNIIFAHDSYGIQIGTVAPKYPNVWIIGGGGGGEPLPSYNNTAHIEVYMQEVAYVCGIIAAMMSQSGKMGYVSAYEIPNTLRTLHAMMLGARTVNPNMTLDLNYIESWYDPPKTQEATIAMIEDGADFFVNDRVGTIEAIAAYPGVYAFGYFSDQWEASPTHVISSMVWNLYPVVEDIVSRYVDGRPLLRTYYWGMSQGVTQLAPWHQLESVVPQAVKDKVANVTEDIISGRLKIPIIETPWTG